VKLEKIVEKLDLKPLNEYAKDRDIAGAYTSDLLSDVIANAEEDELWITLHGHQNVVAVALLKDLAGVIITGEHHATEDMLAKANEMEVSVFKTDLDSFQISGKLYQLLCNDG
jgi:predicted transcriptional regulator